MAEASYFFPFDLRSICGLQYCSMSLLHRKCAHATWWPHIAVVAGDDDVAGNGAMLLQRFETSASTTAFTASASLCMEVDGDMSELSTSSQHQHCANDECIIA